MAATGIPKSREVKTIPTIHELNTRAVVLTDGSNPRLNKDLKVMGIFMADHETADSTAYVVTYKENDQEIGAQVSIKAPGGKPRTIIESYFWSPTDPENTELQTWRIGESKGKGFLGNHLQNIAKVITAVETQSVETGEAE